MPSFFQLETRSSQVLSCFYLSHQYSTDFGHDIRRWSRLEWRTSFIDLYVIQKILTHFDKKHPSSAQIKTIFPLMRAPPQQDFDWGA
jgi:hypothetical protein